jgi:CelD/BcsL family acetyltransferase involved in cellulose biosynthesis
MNFNIQYEFPEQLAGEWKALLEKNSIQSPFLEFQYQKIWWETRGGGEWPDARLLLVTAHQNGQLVGIAPLFSTSQPDGTTAILNIGSIEVSDFLDLLVLPEHYAEFVAGLLAFVSGLDFPAWTTFNLYNLLDSSPTLPVLHTAAVSAGWQVSVEKLEHSPYIELPGDWETYLAGIDKKQRHEIRRKMRRAEESETPVRWYLVTEAAALDAEIDAFLELMKNDGDKQAFLRPAMQDFMHRVIRHAFNEGYLQLAFLEVDGQKAAAYLSFDYQNRIWVYNSGLNRDFQSLSPGWVLLGYLLKWANEQSRKEFDFMRGDEEYKYRFGAVDRFVMRVELTPPSQN